MFRPTNSNATSIHQKDQWDTTEDSAKYNLTAKLSEKEEEDTTRHQKTSKENISFFVQNFLMVASSTQQPHLKPCFQSYSEK